VVDQVLEEWFSWSFQAALLLDTRPRGGTSRGVNTGFAIDEAQKNAL
jgi:hypothetical protein